MKHLALILSSLALFSMLFLSCKDSGKQASSTVVKTDSTGKKVEVSATRVAYIDLDTLEAQYGRFQQKKKSFESREKKIQRELSSKAKAIEASYLSLQKQAQSGSLTQAEGEKKQKSLMKRQESLEKLRNNLTKKLLKDQDTFNKQLKEKLDKVVKEFNKDNKYDYILSYSKEGSIIYVNTKLNITKEVVDLMNKPE